MLELSAHSVQVIVCDRRGVVASFKPWQGYDNDTFADGLKALLKWLDFDNRVVSASVRGSEMVRHMACYSGARIRKIAFVGAVTLLLQKTANNPDGVGKTVVIQMIGGLRKDRPNSLSTFGKQFLNVSMLGHQAINVTRKLRRWLGPLGSPEAAVYCAHLFRHRRSQRYCSMPSSRFRKMRRMAATSLTTKGAPVTWCPLSTHSYSGPDH